MKKNALQTLIFSFLFLLPFQLYSQTNSTLIQKASEVIKLVVEGEGHRNPQPLIKAIKILLAEHKIQPLKVLKTTGSDYINISSFDIDSLYMSAYRMTPKQDRRTSRKLRRLKRKINKKKRVYKRMTFDSTTTNKANIEIKAYTVKPNGTIPITFNLKQGNEVVFYIEVGNNFGLNVSNKINKSKLFPKKDGNRIRYSVKIFQSGEHEFIITNLRSEMETCIIYKQTK